MTRKATMALDRAVKGQQGSRVDLVDNIHEVSAVDRPSGTSAGAAIRRLRKAAPGRCSHRQGPDLLRRPRY